MSIIKSRTLFVVRISRRRMFAFATLAQAEAFRDAQRDMREAGWVK